MTPGACWRLVVLTGGVPKETEEKGSTNGSKFIPLYSELRTAWLLIYKEAMGLLMPCYGDDPAPGHHFLENISQAITLVESLDKPRNMGVLRVAFTKFRRITHFQS